MTPEEQTRFEQARREWEERTLKPSLARSPERPVPFTDSSGAPVERLHTPAETASVDYVRDLGFPGEFPYTRGVQPTMYRGRFWTMRQYAGFGSATETNQRFRYLLEQGQSGLSVAFDLPTQMGYDADHEVARSEVGKVGVAISSVEDMAALFDAIPLDRVSTSMTINATASILLCLYMAVAERQGVPSDRLSGTVQNDILKEYVARGTYVFPPGPVDAAHHRHLRVLPRAGSAVEHDLDLRLSPARGRARTAAQEVAFTLANGIAYVTAAQAAGLKVDEFAPQLSFFFNAHNNLLEEVAKFRAARRLWARIMRDRFDAARPALADAPLPRPDRGQHAHRAAAREQHRAGGGAGPGRGARGLPVAAHQLDGRGAVAAERGGGAHRAPHPAGARPRVGGGRHRGSARRLLLDRAHDAADRGGGARPTSPRSTGSAAPCTPSPSCSARSRRRPTATSRTWRRKQRVVVGVNEFVMDEPPPAQPLPGGRRGGPGPRRAPRSCARTRDACEAARALEAVDRAARGRDNLLPPILSRSARR